MIALDVIVKPNSSRTEILSYDEETETYRVSLKAVPEKGKANKELIKFLSRHFRKKAEIISGFSSRKKRIRLY